MISDVKKLGERESDFGEFFRDLVEAKEREEIITLDETLGSSVKRINYRIKDIKVIDTGFQGHSLFLQVSRVNSPFIYTIQIPMIDGIEKLPKTKDVDSKKDYFVICKNLFMDKYIKDYKIMYEGSNESYKEKIKDELGQELGRFILNNESVKHRVTFSKEVV